LELFQIFGFIVKIFQRISDFPRSREERIFDTDLTRGFDYRSPSRAKSRELTLFFKRYTKNSNGRASGRQEILKK